jgi:hypothetical protein
VLKVGVEPTRVAAQARAAILSRDVKNLTTRAAPGDFDLVELCEALDAERMLRRP